MAKFQQSVVTGHIDVSIGADQRASATNAGGFKLSEKDWEMVESICEEYIAWSRHDQAHPDAAQVSKLVQKINESAKQLQKAIEDLAAKPNDQAPEVARSLIDANTQLMSNPSYLLGPLNDISIASRTALEIISDHTADAKPGRPTESRAFHQFIYMMARIFKRIGGHPTSNWSENRRGGERGGPFIEFVFAVCECLPSEYRPSSKKAVAEKVYRFNKLLKNRRGKTLAEIVDIAPFDEDPQNT